MSWHIKGWMCGGFRAEREDGEMVFIYRRPSWGTGLCGARVFFELRNRGSLVGRISAEHAWRPQVLAQWLGEAGRPLNEADLLEITAALKL